MILWISHIHRPVTIRHRMRWIAHITISRIGGRRLRCIKREFSILAKIKILRLRFPRWPRIKRSPRIAARLEQRRFLQRQRSLVVQPVRKPRCFDFFAKVSTRIVVKRNVTQRIAFASCPSAVIPRPCHQKVVIFLVRLLQPRIGHQRSEHIFLIPPARHI